MQRWLPPSGQQSTIPSRNKSTMIQPESPAHPPPDPTDPAPACSAQGGQRRLGSRHLRVPVIITLTAVIRSVFDRQRPRFHFWRMGINSMKTHRCDFLFNFARPVQTVTIRTIVWRPRNRSTLPSGPVVILVHLIELFYLISLYFISLVYILFKEQIWLGKW